LFGYLLSTQSKFCILGVARRRGMRLLLSQFWGASPRKRRSPMRSVIPIAALEARANQAQPREQTFLYAQLVQQMTELSIRQFAAGDAEKANNLLKRIQQIAQKIHLSLSDNDKRLKNAEM